MSPFGGFLAPAAFLGLLTLPVLILLYFLKLKREEFVTSSTLLWQRSFEEMRVNSPFQRLRRNLLLFLQLAILALGVLGLARPVMNLAASQGRRFILLVDSSASMKTVDVDGRARVEVAREKAIELANDLGRGEEMAVIAFDSTARVLAPFTDSKAELCSAVRSIKALDTTTDMAAAMRIADGLARSRGDASESEIVIISDGGFGSLRDLDRFPGGEGLRRMKEDDYAGEAAIRFVSVGKKASDNTAIVALEARRELSGAGGIEVFCRVANYSDGEASGVLELRLAGELLDAKDLAIPPHEETSTVFESLSWEDGVLEVRYTARDSLALDNVGLAVMSDLREARVLLVADQNFFLDKALRSISGIEAERIDPKTFQSMETSEPEKLLSFDCIICDGVAPQIMKEGNFLLFDAYPPLKDLGPTGGEVQTPQVLDWDPAHPAVRFANFAPLVIQKAPEVRWPARKVTVVQGSGGPLIGAVSEERLNALIVAFDMYESNWPLRRSFPIFLANSVRWLAAGSPRRARANMRTGEIITIYPSGAQEGMMSITDPDGVTHKVSCGSESASHFSATNRVGVYRGRLGDEKYVWAVNLFSSSESNNAAADSFEIGAEGKQISAGEIRRNREVWKHLAVVALVILCLEWWIYNRRMYF